MPFYKTIGVYEPSKEIKTEQDILEAIKELKEGHSRLDIWSNLYLPALKKSLQTGKKYIEINGKSIKVIPRIDISALTQAMQNYESLRNNPDFKHILGENPRPLQEILKEI